MNSISIAIEKLQMDTVLDGVYAVRIPDGVRKAVVVNRVTEEDIDGLTCATLAVTCCAETFDEAEDMGAAAAETFGDGGLFFCGDVDDIEFEKMSGDITGYDETRSLFMRQLQIAVKW